MLEVFARRHYPCPVGRKGLFTAVLARRSAEVVKACQMRTARTKDRELPFFFLFPWLARLVPQCFGSSFLLVIVFLAHKGQKSRYNGSASGSYFPICVTN